MIEVSTTPYYHGTFFITKKQSRTDNEPSIGEFLRKIKGSERYFSPALEVHPVALATMKHSEVHSFEQAAHEFVSVKMKYVGERTIRDNFRNHKEKHPASLYPHILDMHIHISCALEALVIAQIVHHDINENNIMYSDALNVPVLIHFGTSFFIKDLYTGESLKSLFSSTTSTSPLEMALIAKLIKKDGWENKKVNLDSLWEVVDDFFEFNPVVILLKKTIDVDYYKSKWVKYVDNLDSKRGKTAIKILLDSWKTWDIYSANVMFLTVLCEPDGSFPVTEKCIKDYVFHVQYLTDKVLCVPDKRSNPTETLRELQEGERSSP